MADGPVGLQGSRFLLQLAGGVKSDGAQPEHCQRLVTQALTTTFFSRNVAKGLQLTKLGDVSIKTRKLEEPCS
jgi:hypothetical protein